MLTEGQEISSNHQVESSDSPIALFISIEDITTFVKDVAEMKPVSVLAWNGPTNTRVTWDGATWQFPDWQVS